MGWAMIVNKMDGTHAVRALSMAVVGECYYQVQSTMCTHRVPASVWLTAIAYAQAGWRATRFDAIINFIMCIKCNYMHPSNTGRARGRGGRNQINRNWKKLYLIKCTYERKMGIKWWVISCAERIECASSTLRTAAAAVVHPTTSTITMRQSDRYEFRTKKRECFRFSADAGSKSQAVNAIRYHHDQINGCDAKEEGEAKKKRETKQIQM